VWLAWSGMTARKLWRGGISPRFFGDVLVFIMLLEGNDIAFAIEFESVGRPMDGYVAIGLSEVKDGAFLFGAMSDFWSFDTVCLF
jgi:hypothetical protein